MLPCGLCGGLGKTRWVLVWKCIMIEMQKWKSTSRAPLELLVFVSFTINVLRLWPWFSLCLQEFSPCFDHICIMVCLPNPHSHIVSRMLLPASPFLSSCQKCLNITSKKNELWQKLFDLFFLWHSVALCQNSMQLRDNILCLSTAIIPQLQNN